MSLPLIWLSLFIIIIVTSLRPGFLADYCSACQTRDCDGVFVFLVGSLQVDLSSPRLGVKTSHAVFQMKMEDMPLSGPDNTKLEVAVNELLASHLPFVSFIFLPVESFYVCACRLWSMTSTLSWLMTPVWVFALTCTELSSRATSSWMRRTRRA